MGDAGFWLVGERGQRPSFPSSNEETASVIVTRRAETVEINGLANFDRARLRETGAVISAACRLSRDGLVAGTAGDRARALACG